MPQQTVTLHPNIADEASVQAKIKRELIPLLTRVRRDRDLITQKLLRYNRIWKVERDHQAYHGRQRAYLAIGRRIIENWVQKLKGDLFPSEEWFDVVPTREAFADRVPGIKSLFQVYMRKYMRLRRLATPYLRGLVTYGTAPVEVGWKLDERMLPTLQEALDPDGNPTGRFEEKAQQLLKYIGPTFRPVDIFLWYIWPNTPQEIRNASLIFEDMLIDRSRIEQLGKTPLDPRAEDLGTVFKNAQKALDLLVTSGVQGAKDKFQAERDRLQAKSLSSRIDTIEDPGRPLDITKCHWKTNFDGEDDVWWQVVLGADDIVLQVRRNPWWMDEPNYLVGKFVEMPQEFYGEGLPGVFDQLQYFLNDVLNQSSDALVWSMNPIAAVDLFAVQDPTSIRMRPGAKWLVKDPSTSVQFKEPPKDTAAIGFTAVQQLIALMNDVSNVAPFGAAGIQSGGRSRGRALQTAAGMQIVLSEALVQVRDVVTNLEDQVYNPLLAWMHTLTMQCLDRPMILRLAGTQGAEIIEARVTRTDVIGDYEFSWLGSTHVHNQQVRAQQMIQFLTVVSRVPPEALAQQNAEINWPFLLRQIWTDGMGLRSGAQVVRERMTQRTVDPAIENELIRQGQGADVQVSPADDDLAHAKRHDNLLTEDLPGPIREDAVSHIRSHMASFIAKQLLQQQQELMQNAQGGAPGGAGGGAAAQAPGRLPSTMSPDDLFRRLPRIGSTAANQ